jgi:hypothetical protein
VVVAGLRLHRLLLSTVQRHQQQFADHRGQAINGGNNRNSNGGLNLVHRDQHFNQLIKPAQQIANDNRNLVLKKLNANDRQAALQQGRDWQHIREARTLAEHNAAKNGGVNITGGQNGANGQNLFKKGDNLGAGNKLASQLGAEAKARGAAGNDHARLRVDAPNGPKAVFHLPPSKNAGAGGNQVVTGRGRQNSGLQHQNQNQLQNQATQQNQADRVQQLRDQLNSRFGGNRAADNRGSNNPQAEAALRQFNRGTIVRQPNADAQPGGNPFVPFKSRTGERNATTGAGNAAGGVGNAGASQLYRAARPQIDFNGPRPRVESGVSEQKGDMSPFRGSGPTNFGRFGNSPGRSVDAATQLYRGGASASGGANMRTFRMPSGEDRGGVGLPSTGGGALHLRSGNQSIQNFRGGDVGSALRSFNAGGNRGAGVASPAIQAAPQVHNLGGSVNGGGGNLSHRHDRHP